MIALDHERQRFALLIIQENGATKGGAKLRDEPLHRGLLGNLDLWAGRSTSNVTQDSALKREQQLVRDELRHGATDASAPIGVSCGAKVDKAPAQPS